MFDRSKFQGAKLSAQKSAQKSASENSKSFGGGNNRVDFFSIEEGRNVFRMMPPHPDDKLKASYLPKRTAMLKCEVPVFENGEDTGRKEVKNKNIFIATQHGGLPKDPIELYIEYVRKYAVDAIQDKEERTKYLYPITGWRDKKGWNWGVNPKTSFVGYVVSKLKVGRLELYESMVKDMDKMAIGEDPEDVMGIDPFSDPNEGFPFVITKQHVVDKQGKTTDKWEYPITKEEPRKVAGRWESMEDFFERTKVTDEQLMELIAQEPLSTLYGPDVYTTRDWDYALDGLKRFDDEHKYGIFDNEEFLDELEVLSKLVPEDKREEAKAKVNGDDIDKVFDDKKKADAAKASKEEANAEVGSDEAEENGKSEDEVVTLPEMKFILKKFIRKEFGEEFVSQLPANKLDVEMWYSLYEEGEPLPIVPLATEAPKKEVKAEEPKKEVKADVVVEENPELDDEIAKLRARRNARNNQ